MALSRLSLWQLLVNLGWILLLPSLGYSQQTLSNLECYIRQGKSYRGYHNKTRNGIPCQAWKLQMPHSHPYGPESNPNAGLISNYCRNPSSSDRNRPWCYTVSKNISWDYCQVEKCNEDCYIGDGANYQGTAAITQSGQKCQAWQDNQLSSDESPNARHNYCRNPGGTKRKPYCYISQESKRWEYCRVDNCKVVNKTINAMPTEESIQFYPITRECMLGKGTTYRGGQDRTKSGLVCQNWLSQYPHRHSFTPATYPEFGLGDHNYCRNPDNSNDGPWCFTSSISRRSEACSVPRCAPPVINRELAKSQNEILPNASKPWSVCCQADGLPTPNITWWTVNSGENNLMLPTQRGCYILDSRIQDGKAQLRCIAQNVAGRDSITIDVVIPKYQPTSKPMTTSATSQDIQTIHPEDNTIINIILPLGITTLLVLLIIAISCFVFAYRVLLRKNVRIERNGAHFRSVRNDDEMAGIRAHTEFTDIDQSSSVSSFRRPSERASSIYASITSNLPYPKHMHVSRGRIAIGERLFESTMHGSIHRGSVYKIVPHEWKSTVLVKQLSDGCTIQQHSAFYDELNMLLKIGAHKNLLSLLGASFESKHSKESLLLILEYASYGDLESFLRYKREEFEPSFDYNEAGFNLATLGDFACQIAKGMHHLSRMETIHGNLRAATVLVCSNMVLKVADYGVQTNTNEMQGEEDSETTAANKVQLPIRWMSMQTLSDGILTVENDVWSYGIVLWELYTLGELPYYNIADDVDVLLHYVSSGYRLSQPNHCPDSIYDIMLACWKSKLAERITFQAIVAKLREIKVAEVYQLDDSDHPSLQRCASTFL